MPADAPHLLRVVHDVLLASRNGPGDAYGVKSQGLELLQRHVGVPGGLKGVDLTEGNRRLQDHAVPVRLVARELRSRAGHGRHEGDAALGWLDVAARITKLPQGARAAGGNLGNLLHLRHQLR